ncbi:MAG: RIP metalloprotease RseP [Gammaproteobacteria bacterium]|nr:RIP metalloprotease RseP [Gammaproteobacteria bacterium]MBU1414962.1 RIP metalloprotease RseP [Gammaproteobacteria bacterium]
MASIPFLWYIGAFLVALGVLIVVHELGHYLMARWVGIKVLRFSVGFGKPLLSRRFGSDNTEWALAAFPLGGYVKMLDEREDTVPEAELHRAFNRQPVGRRALVVAAGPIANLLLAVALYWLLFVGGVSELRPLLAAPPPGTAAAQAGVEAEDEVLRVSGTPVATMLDFRWQLMKLIADRQPVKLEVKDRDGAIRIRMLSTEAIDSEALNADFTRGLGLSLFQPRLEPVIGTVVADSVAQAAGLIAGDRVRSINGKPISTWTELAMGIRESAGNPIVLEVVRGGMLHELRMVPAVEIDGGKTIGRIGIGIWEQPEVRARMMIEIRLGPIDALLRAVERTWDTSIFSLRMIGRMLIGEQSWKNISGPVTIADYAGQSARLGPSHFLKFLALISISLGVLNLLPIPILDGGHLLYYFFEVIKGGPLSERAMEIGQQIGIGLLALLMAFAFFNDINRLISG